MVERNAIPSIRTEAGYQDSDWAEYFAALNNHEHGPTAYVFRCRHCGTLGRSAISLTPRSPHDVRRVHRMFCRRRGSRVAAHPRSAFGGSMRSMDFTTALVALGASLILAFGCAESAPASRSVPGRRCDGVLRVHGHDGVSPPLCGA